MWITPEELHRSPPVGLLYTSQNPDPVPGVKLNRKLVNYLIVKGLVIVGPDVAFTSTN